MNAYPIPHKPCPGHHTLAPRDPTAWWAWVDGMRATHTVTECVDCGRFLVWRLNT